MRGEERRLRRTGRQKFMIWAVTYFEVRVGAGSWSAGFSGAGWGLEDWLIMLYLYTELERAAKEETGEPYLLNATENVLIKWTRKRRKSQN